MILYTSGIKQKKSRQASKTIIVYIVITSFCIAFNNIYALYGHGVSSDSMTYMFLFPLLGGVLPFLILSFSLKKPETICGYRFFYNSYHSGIALLTVKSLLYGIFEIAGTSSPYLIVFTVCGLIFLGIGLFGILFKLIIIRE